MNKVFAVQIVETLSRTIAIEAEDSTEANRIAREMYSDGQIILDYDDFSDVEIYTTADFYKDSNPMTREEIENIYGDIITVSK